MSKMLQNFFGFFLAVEIVKKDNTEIRKTGVTKKVLSAP